MSIKITFIKTHFFRNCFKNLIRINFTSVGLINKVKIQRMSLKFQINYYKIIKQNIFPIKIRNKKKKVLLFVKYHFLNIPKNLKYYISMMYIIQMKTTIMVKYSVVLQDLKPRSTNILQKINSFYFLEIYFSRHYQVVFLTENKLSLHSINYLSMFLVQEIMIQTKA